MISESQKRAVKKYKKENFIQVSYLIRKEFKYQIEEHAKKHGESINGFITRSVKNQMEIDNRNENTQNPEKAENESN